MPTRKDKVYSLYHQVKGERQCTIQLYNIAHQALIIDRAENVLIDVSAQGCYDDGRYPLKLVLALSARGFDSELRSELCTTKDETGTIVRCSIKQQIEVTLSDRKPQIEPYLVEFPGESRSSVIPLEYAEAYLEQVSKWLGHPRTIEQIVIWLSGRKD